MNGSGNARLAFSSKLWLGLASYVLVVDIYAMLTERETLSEGLYNALVHPKKRWPVIIGWILTTKHLFFRKFISWLDPFALIALVVTLIKRIIGGKK